MVRGNPKYDQKRTGSRQQALKLSHIVVAARQLSKSQYLKRRARTEQIRKTARFACILPDRFASDSF